jgi:glycosyltransferase involved in cell wall biosynthesis
LHGCDVLVNTDGDNQYPAQYIPELLQPIIDGNADIVIGNRKPWTIAHFSPIKRCFQWFGKTLINLLIGGDVPDVVSGFRAYSAEAFLRLNPVVGFSYVLDTLIQAVQKDLRIVSIPVNTNLPTRPSRLFSNIFQYMYQSGKNVLWMYIIYAPFKTFVILATIFLLPAIYFFFGEQSDSHIHFAVIFFLGLSLVYTLICLGVIALLINNVRSIVEELLYLEKQRKWNAARGGE